MDTITKQFEAFAEGQKKMYEFWSGASKKMMETFSADAKTTTPEDLLKEWYEAQKGLFEEAMKIGDPKEAFEKAPEQFKKWTDLQTSFSEKWMKQMNINPKSLGMEMPKSWNGDFKGFNSWMNDSTKWIRDNMMDKLPTNMQPHLEGFTKAYDDLSTYWNTFVKMMEFGIYNKEAVDKYFSPDAYKNLVNQFMGYSKTLNMSELIDQANEMFEKTFSQFQNNMPTVEHFMNGWTDQMNKMSGGDSSPYFHFLADLNEQVRENLTPYYNVLGPTKEVNAAKIIRDIQFTYIAFIVKSAEMQNMVYQSGQHALPETLKSFYDDYQEQQELPEYDAFFNRYVNVLEKHITVVLESDEYSKLQNAVAKAGLGVKSKMEEFVELSFVDMPFVMRSEANDIAQEASSLRKKVRSLERKLAAIEKSLAEADKPAEKSTPSRSTRRKPAAKSTKTTTTATKSTPNK